MVKIAHQRIIVAHCVDKMLESQRQFRGYVQFLNMEFRPVMCELKLSCMQVAVDSLARSYKVKLFVCLVLPEIFAVRPLCEGPPAPVILSGASELPVQLIVIWALRAGRP